MAPRRAPAQRPRGLGLGVAACAAGALASQLGAWVASRGFLAVTRGAAAGRGTALRAVDITNPAALEAMMKDPEKMKKLQADVDQIMADPEKRKAMEAWQQQVQSAVEKLKTDPEMTAFFEDVEKNGYEAMKKYEGDERILRKFSEATGGPEGMRNLVPGAAAAAPVPNMPPAWKPGDEVFIRGLKAKPELNGKKAMVVPPTSEEREKLKGTGRLIVRLLDTGDQFAVKPDNLRTTAQEADELIGGNLEDIPVYNQALQTEAAKLRESGKLEDLQNDPELKPVFEDIKKNGMAALEKYWNDEQLMAKISKAMGTR